MPTAGRVPAQFILRPVLPATGILPHPNIPGLETVAVVGATVAWLHHEWPSAFSLATAPILAALIVNRTAARRRTISGGCKHFC